MTQYKILSGFALLIFLLGCRYPSPEEKQSVEKTPPAPEYKIHTVEIRQMQFIPAAISVKKGDRIVFVNHDMVNHDVTEISKAWSSSALEPEKYWTLTATVSQNYYCSIHAVMKGSIRVE